MKSGGIETEINTEQPESTMLHGQFGLFPSLICTFCAWAMHHLYAKEACEILFCVLKINPIRVDMTLSLTLCSMFGLLTLYNVGISAFKSEEMPSCRTPRCWTQLKVAL